MAKRTKGVGDTRKRSVRAARLTPALRAKLGIPAGTALSLGLHVSMPPGTVARGETGSIPTLDDLLRGGMALSDVAIQGHPEVRIRRHDREPGVLFVESPRQRVTVAGPAHALGEGAWALDSRTVPAWACVWSLPSPYVLRVERGGLDVFGFRLTRDSRSPVGTSVQIEHLLGSDRAPPWLLEPAKELAGSRRAVDRVAAAALIARLWIPLGASSESYARVRAEDSPPHRALSWFQGLPNSERLRARREAVADLAKLRRSVSKMPGLVSGGGRRSANAVLEWLHRRDDLEGVALLFERAGRDSSLRRKLNRLDRLASTHLSALARPNPRSDERLRQVRWREPHAWWAGLVTGS